MDRTAGVFFRQDSGLRRKLVDRIKNLSFSHICDWLKLFFLMHADD